MGDVKSMVLWERKFPVMSKKIAKRLFSSIWHRLDLEWRLNFAGENCPPGGKGYRRVCRRKPCVIGDSA